MPWPPGLPVPQDWTDDTDATTVHAAAHNTIGAALDDIVERVEPETFAVALGLGKLIEIGYNGAPTWIDPAADDWADVVANDFGWVQFVYTPGTGSIQVQYGRGTGTNVMLFTVDGTNAFFQGGAGGASFAFQAGPNFDFALFPFSGSIFEVSDNGTKLLVEITSPGGQTDPIVDIESGMFAIAPDGSVGGVTPSPGSPMAWDGAKWIAVGGASPEIAISSTSAGTGGVDWQSNATKSQVHVAANTGQTDPVLVVSSDSEDIFAIEPDGTVGGVTPSPGDVLTWDGTKMVWAAP